ncbi:MAG: prepilin-type N-terminal cleavage/methylation domain-containing protein [Syntrophaceae bacterium]|nr:prepilin-type N-terminal cleavage/methylation domain-containing protein [Syntrophaceae bacterium]
MSKTIRNQKGFTLIEIIAVLVILGILAAVAVPKFMDLQDEAKTKAVKGALAEGMSTMSMAYAKLTLSTGSTPGIAAVATKAAATAPTSTDFSYTFASSGLVTVNGLEGLAGFSATKTWRLPE